MRGLDVRVAVCLSCGLAPIVFGGCEPPPGVRAVGPHADPVRTEASARADDGAAAREADPRLFSAISHLDARVTDWMEHTPSVGNNVACATTCHTSLPAALLHGSAGSDGPVMERLRDRVEARVEGAPTWTDATPFYGAKGSPKDRESLGSEAVSNAATLAALDRAGGRNASEITLRAFDAMWSTMRPDGGFDWLDFGLEPFEHGESAIGAAFAARAVGLLPGGAARFPAEVGRLRSKLVSTISDAETPLFDAALCAWSLARVGGLRAFERDRLVAAAIAAQRRDGAWSWSGAGIPRRVRTRRGHSEVLSATPRRGGRGIRGARGGIDASDPLPTAVVLLGLCDATDAPAIDARRRGLAWLVTRQSDDGAYPSTSPNRDGARTSVLLTDAATGFAALARLECAP